MKDKKIKELEEALLDAGSHLVGAASAYRKYARRYKTRGPSDPFFNTRMKDFENAASRTQQAIRKLVDER